MPHMIKVYHDILKTVQFVVKALHISMPEQNTTGRPLAIPIIHIIAYALFQHLNGIPTKKAIHRIFDLSCSYKTLVVNMNRFALQSLLILAHLLKLNQGNAHLVKHTDSTDIPVCLAKNANCHRTMKGLAAWGHSGKGFYYGLKLHLTSDLKRNILAVKFTSGNVHDKEVFFDLNKNLEGVFVADAAYIDQALNKEFHIEGKRALFAKPRRNMRKIMTKFQEYLYGTRMLIELNFKNLKQFYGLITSLPRSVNGYLANYVHSLLAYIVC